VYQTEDLSAADLAQVRSFFDRVDPLVEVKIARPQSFLLKDSENREKYFIQRAWGYRGVASVERKAVPND
jgi:hypothetical protein